MSGPAGRNRALRVTAIVTAAGFAAAVLAVLELRRLINNLLDAW